MGGLNSGSRHRSGRPTDGELHRLSVSEVRLAIGVRAFAQRIRELEPHPAGITVRVKDEDTYALGVVRDEGPSTIAYGLAESLAAESPRQFVALVQTRPAFGGTRYWFRCPRVSCGRRCAVLYRERQSNARAFVCRSCIRFRYATQVLGDSDLILHRAGKLLVQCHLQSDGSIRRRKGMHRRTFTRLAAMLDDHAIAWKTTSPIARHFERALAAIERQVTAAHGA